ncbi:MAG: hypothetical protein DSY91_00365 [Deltaproteobacteria bacterium]|nr:MAG: hypothetical protein DSY91_00365 [Deltaproteobacteria bacterium]
MNRRNRGFFLILVVAVVAALAAILVNFGVDAQLDTLTSGNFRDGVKARQKAKSVLEGAKIAIEKGQWHEPEVIPFISKQMGHTDICKGWIVDEEGKLPVNRLIYEGEDGIEILRRYWVIKGGSPASFHALVDWVDRDDTTVYGETESSFYGKLGKLPPNRSLQSPYEIAIIPFMKKEIERLKKLKEPPLTRDLTVWGDGKVNLLTASRDVLMSLSDGVTPELAERIIEERDLGHIREMDDFVRVIHVPPAVNRAFQKWGTLRSTAFRVYVEAEYRKVRFALWVVFEQRGGRIKTLYYREGLWQPA